MFRLFESISRNEDMFISKCKQKPVNDFEVVGFFFFAYAWCTTGVVNPVFNTVPSDLTKIQCTAKNVA